MDENDDGICPSCRESLKLSPGEFMVGDSGLIHSCKGVREPTYKDLDSLKKLHGVCSDAEKTFVWNSIRAVVRRLQRSGTLK